MGPLSIGGVVMVVFYFCRGTIHMIYMVTSIPLHHQKSGTSARAVVRGRKEYLEYLQTH